MQIVMFSKMLKEIGNLTIEKAGDQIAKLGFNGVDLTVRARGYILPEEVTHKLPEAIDTLKSKGLIVPMITTNITSASEKYADEIFRTASECDVKFIKLGYWRYEGFGKIRKQIKAIRRSLIGIQKLSREYNITSGIHTHSGSFVTASPEVLYMLLNGFDPEYLCAYIDPGHMVVEGGRSGWEIGLDLLSDYVRIVAVKDFGWFKIIDPHAGEVKWKVKTVPLGEGLVPWSRVFEDLKRIGFDGVISVHSEYYDVDLDELLSRTRRDLEYLRKIIGSLWRGI